MTAERIVPQTIWTATATGSGTGKGRALTFRNVNAYGRTAI
jgi:hypothetical protein